MKATVHFWCKPVSKDASYDAEDIKLTVFLPFIPQVGMDLKLTPEGEFHKVDGVSWDLATPDELWVFLEEPKDHEDLEEWGFMQAQGWKLA